MPSKTATKRSVEQDSKKRVAFQVRLFSEAPADESSLPTEIQVVPTGEWEHPLWGSMKIDEEDITQFVQNFNAGIRKAKIPVTAGHSVMEELPAIGWFTELFDRGKEGLWATVDWTNKGKELLMEGAYKYFSPEYYPVYEDPATLMKHKNVLVGGALTNHPFFRELEDVVAFSEPFVINQFSEIMNIEDILKKTAEERTEEEVAFLEENKDDLTDEQAAQLASEVSGAEEEETEDETPEETPEEGAEEEVQASEPTGKVVTMSAVEAKALREKADLGARAFSELEKMKVSEAVGKMVFSATNSAGRFLPKQKDAVEKFVFSLNEKQRDQFTNIINNMPKAAEFSELGDGGSEDKSVAASLDAEVEKVMKADNLGYSDALKKVVASNPELADYSEGEED